MLHFSCDLCGQPLDDRRYVVRMEVYPAFDPELIDEEDLDIDHLQEIAEVIHEMETSGQQTGPDCETKQLRYDLCSDCRRKFVKDPLGRDAFRRLNFSQN